MNADELGKDAVTQFRKSAKLKHKEQQQKKEEQEKKEAILKEKYSKWSKGLVVYIRYFYWNIPWLVHINVLSTKG